MCRLQLIALVFVIGILCGCHRTPRDAKTVVFLIESSPANLDPRMGIDAQSQHINELIYDGLVVRDSRFHFLPSLAVSWEQPNALTLVFHLRHDVRFQNGEPLTARDVVWTLNSMRDGTIVSPRAASYASVQSAKATNAYTVEIALRQPDNFLLANLARGALGVVPFGSGREFGQHPVGSGPFRLTRQEMDKEVVLERSPYSWEPGPSSDRVERVRFAVVPDGITRALELRKGSADLASNALTADALPVLAQEPRLSITSVGGTMVQYLGFNTVDPALRDRRVRQAIACAIDRELIRRTLLGGRARLALSLLPPEHWAYTDEVARYEYDLVRARSLLDQAGKHPDSEGVRLRLTMETSTDEGTRLLAATLQQQLAQVGIRLEIRSYETATFLQDLTRGSFQMYSLRWIGGNEQPDIFSYAFSAARIPPKGANRGRYRNPMLDSLLEDAAKSADESRRRANYVRAQQMLADDLPVLPLWYLDSIVVASRRLSNLRISPSGSYTFLMDARVDQTYPLS